MTQAGQVLAALDGIPPPWLNARRRTRPRNPNRPLYLLLPGTVESMSRRSYFEPASLMSKVHGRTSVKALEKHVLLVDKAEF
jgi:hypothetical protein